jgi:serine/threonine protein kinase
MSSISATREYNRLQVDFMEEMRQMSKLRHPCITTVMGAVVEHRSEPMLIMEYMELGSLYDMLHNDTVAMEMRMALDILRDVAQGLRFLHSANPRIVSESILEVVCVVCVWIQVNRFLSHPYFLLNSLFSLFAFCL